MVTYPDIAATTSSKDSFGRMLIAGETARKTVATSSIRGSALSLGNKAVAPWRHMTGVLGIDLTTGVSFGSQLWTWATEIPGHIVTTVGLDVTSRVSTMPANSRQTCGTSIGRVQIKTTCVSGRFEAAVLHMAASRLLFETVARGNLALNSLTCSCRRAVTEILQSSFQLLLVE